MFNKGANLSNGLIDDKRLFTVMNKVKTLANASKLISYKDICSYTNEIEE